MSHPIPPILPVPGEGRRVNPPPLPGVGTYPPVVPGAPFDDAPATEEEVILRQEEERRRQQDLVDLLTEDHRAIRELFEALADPQTPQDRRGQIAEVTVAELSRHAAVERRYLIPTVREKLTRSDEEAQVVDRMLDELALIEDATSRLHHHEPDEEEFDRWSGELSQVFDRRASFQEEHLFPKLRQATDPDELRELAKRARSTKETAPTRPHPRAPERPPWNRITDPVIGVADKVRDEMTGRPTERREIG